MRNVPVSLLWATLGGPVLAIPFVLPVLLVHVFAGFAGAPAEWLFLVLYVIAVAAYFLVVNQMLHRATERTDERWSATHWRESKFVYIALPFATAAGVLMTMVPAEQANKLIDAMGVLGLAVMLGIFWGPLCVISVMVNALYLFMTSEPSAMTTTITKTTEVRKHGTPTGVWYVLFMLAANVAHWLVSSSVHSFAGIDMESSEGMLAFGALYGVAVEKISREELDNDAMDMTGPLWKRHLWLCSPIYLLSAMLFIGVAIYGPSLLHVGWGNGGLSGRDPATIMMVRVVMVWLGMVPAMLLTNMVSLAMKGDAAKHKNAV